MAATTTVERWWATDVAPALEAEAQRLHRAVSSTDHSAAPRHQRHELRLLITRLVAQDKGAVDAAARLAAAATEAYVQLHFVLPVGRILSERSAAGDRPLVDFKSPNPRPLRYGEDIDAECAADIAGVLARETPLMQEWVEWLAFVCGYVDKVGALYEGTQTISQVAASALARCVVDGLDHVIAGHIRALLGYVRDSSGKGEESEALEARRLCALLQHAYEAPRRVQQSATFANGGVGHSTDDDASQVFAEAFRQNDVSQPPWWHRYAESVLRPAFRDGRDALQRRHVAAEGELPSSFDTLLQRLRCIQAAVHRERELFERVLMPSGRGDAATRVGRAVEQHLVENQVLPLVASQLRWCSSGGHGDREEEGDSINALEGLLMAMPHGEPMRKEHEAVVDQLVLPADGVASTPDDIFPTATSKLVRDACAASLTRALEAAAVAAQRQTSSSGPSASLCICFVEGMHDVWHRFSSAGQQEREGMPSRDERGSCCWWTPGMRRNAAIQRAVNTALAQALGQELPLSTTSAAVGTAAPRPPAHPAVLLARYVDLSLRGGRSEEHGGVSRPSHSTTATIDERIGPLIALLPDRDTFAAEYERDLSERLFVLRRDRFSSASSPGNGPGGLVEQESALLAGLRPRTSELQRAVQMLHDFTTAVEASEREADQQRVVGAQAASSAAASLATVRLVVLPQGRWHLPSRFGHVLPPAPLRPLFAQLERQWCSGHGRRQLVWNSYAGHGTVALRVGSAPTRELTGSLAACALLYAIDSRTLSLQEVAAEVGLDPAHSDAFREGLHGLALVPKLLLVSWCDGTTQQVVEDHRGHWEPLAVQHIRRWWSSGGRGSARRFDGSETRVRINPDFDGKRRGEIPRVVRRGAAAEGGGSAGGGGLSAVPKEVLARRRLQVDAAVTRVMKQRKTSALPALVAEVQDVLQASFTCPSKLVRESVSTLIEREFLERVEEGPAPMLRFLA